MTGVAAIMQSQSRYRFLQDPALGVLSFDSHELSNSPGDADLIGWFVHDNAFSQTRSDEQRKNFMRRARVEVMLTRHVGQRIAVASAIGHHNEDSIFAIFRIG